MKKNKIIIFAIIIVAVLVSIWIANSNKEVQLLGKWLVEYENNDGEIWYSCEWEFYSDGTMAENGKMSSKHPMTYEMLKEGYLKIGTYDSGWFAYDYDMFSIDEASKKKLVLSSDDYKKVTMKRK